MKFFLYLSKHKNRRLHAFLKQEDPAETASFFPEEGLPEQESFQDDIRCVFDRQEFFPGEFFYVLPFCQISLN